MGISYPAVNINPGYMPPGPPAQPWLLQALLGAAEAFQRAQELKLARGQQASIASRENARIGLEAQRLSFETRQAADARAQLEALGRAYPQLIAALAGNGQAPTPQAAPSLPGVFDPRALLGVPQLTQQMPQTPVFNIPSVPQSAPAGMLVPGNIDVTNRPRVQNPDGTISTVRSMSFGENGREILVPTISPDGRLLNSQQAIDLYHQTGQHLGVFQDPGSATLYAQQLHNAQAAALAGNGNGMVPYPSSGNLFAPPANPFAALNAILPNIPAAAVPDFLRTSAPLVQLAAAKQSESAELARLDAAVKKAYPKDPEKQAAFGAVVALVKGGVGNLNPEMMQTAFGLDPKNGAVDPQRLNAAVNLWQTGQVSWGQVRDVAGIPRSKVPDDAVFPVKSATNQTADQGRIQSLLPSMLDATQTINGLIDSGVRVGFKGSLLQGVDKPGLWQGFVNSIQNDKERALVDASLHYGQNWVFAISGAQTNSREVFSTLQTVLPTQGDDNATLTRKRQTMDALNRGLLLRANGHIPNTATALVNAVLSDPTLPPNARAVIQRQRAIAAQYDKAVTEGRAPIAAPDAPAQNVPDAVSTFGILIDQLPDSALGMGRASAAVPPGAVTGTGIGMALDAYRKQHQTTPPRTSP